MKDLVKMLEDCVEAAKTRNHPFNAWELEFIESVSNQFELTGSLSKTQENKLEQIWDKI